MLYKSIHYMYRIYLKRFDLSITQNGLFAHGGCIREARKAFCSEHSKKSVLLYMTAAAQLQGARLPAGRRRRSNFFHNI